jgi:LysR family transcriptional regulator, repressor for citA
VPTQLPDMDKFLEIRLDKINLPTSSIYVLTKVETDEARIFIRFLKEELAKF